MPSITRQRVLRAGAFTAAISLIASGLVVLGGGFASAISGEVGGMVFRDFDSNGRYDTGNAPLSGIPNDVPLPGVTVTVYDRFDDQRGTAVSGADGTYRIATGLSDTTQVRVEFTDLPDGYFPTFASDAAGVANGTSVQFVQVGEEHADFGANLPEDYNQGHTWLAVPLHVQGDPAQHPDMPAIGLVPYANPGADDDAKKGYRPPTVATQGQTGTLWGTAWDSPDRTLYASAVYKRQSGLGPLGLGGIYRLPGLLDDANEIVPGTPVEAWLDVESLTVVGTGEPVDVGDVPSNADRGLNGHSQPAVDRDAYERAGKVGILGIAISGDGKTLFFLNGNDRNVYAIDISDPDVTPTQATRIPLHLADGERPWAVETRNGQLYVGFVDSGEDLPAGSTAAEGGLGFTVVSTPLASPGAWTPVLTGPLDYARQPGGWFDGAPAASRWNAWTDQWQWDQERNGVKSVATTRINTSGEEYRMQVFPQAVLSDLSFDRDGFLVVSLMDRVALQGGLRNYPLENHVPGVYYIARTVGDILVAAPVAGGWALEHDGGVGSRTTSKSTSNTAAGPGGGEFLDDYAPSNPTLEKEFGFGSAAVPPGMTAAAATGGDIFQDQTNGVLWFDLENGANTKTGVTASVNFSKAPGLGGIDDLALEAPVQIGDYVWYDANQDGLQGTQDIEPPIAGVTVELFDAGGTKVAGTVTDEHGYYSFSSTTVPGFVPDADYSVQFTLPTQGNLWTGDARFGTVPWSAVEFTTRFADPAKTETDSNVDANGSTGVFHVGGPGHNDHSLDAGILANATLEVRKQIDDQGEPAVPGQTFTLLVEAEYLGSTLALPDDGRYAVEAGGSQFVTVPSGTLVEVTEDDSDPRTVSYDVTPAGRVQVSAGAAPHTIVTVTNTLRAYLGTFEIVKEVSGSGTSPIGDDDVFTAEWATDPGGPWTTIEFTTAGPVGPDEQFQDGTVIYLRELTPPDVPGVQWGVPSYSGATVVNGLARFEIRGDELVTVTIDNPTTGLGGFELTKTITGPGAGTVEPGQEFTVEYELNGGAAGTGSLRLTAGGAPVGLDGLPIGTQVRLTEVEPDGPSWIDWGTPVFTGDGVTVDGDGAATFTIGAVGTIAIELTNRADRLENDVQLRKTVVGGGVGEVADDVEFSVDWHWVAGNRSDSGTARVSTGQTVTIPDVPRGAILTVVEDDLPSIGGITWGPIRWSGPGVDDNGNGSATVQISGGQLIELELENSTELLRSGFSVSKLVSGSGADHLPPGTEFEIEYTLDGQAQTPLVVTPSQPASVTDLPHGATVTLTEVALPQFPHIQWGIPVWTVNGAPVGNGGTVSFEVDGNTAIQLELHNDATLLEGDFSISKAVTGPGSGLVDDDLVFTGTYEWSGGQGEFEVRAGETWMLEEPLPAGTEVTISELAPAGGLPDGYNWGDPRYSVDGADPVAGPVTITIGDGATVEVAIDNPTTINTGRFTITKKVLGEDVVAPDFRFTGTYTYEGQTSTGTFEVVKDGTWTGPDLPMGTVVTIGEVTPTGGLPDGYGWGTPQFVVDGEFVGDSAQITIGNETTIAVELRNRVTHPDVKIEKGDGIGDTIEHDADTVDDAERYAPGETRTIVIRVQNTGDEELQNVALTDFTLSGADIQSLVWEFPDGTTTDAEFAAGVWTAQWEQTFGADATESWAPGDWITGTATLTVSDGDVPHADNVVVDAIGRFSGVPVHDEDRYHGFTASIQLIKYDGEKPDPAVREGGDWITPAKPMDDPYQDANTLEFAVPYPISAPQRVRMVATNTGHTWLTEVDLTDHTDFGPQVTNIVADLSPIGGPDSWSFTEQGPWAGPWAPGTSFFLEGELMLPAESTHGNTATLNAIVVRPAVDADGVPTGEPALDNGIPVPALTEDGTPWRLTDFDPFHAYTGSAPPLPNTGAGVQPWPLALLLLGAGVLLLAAARLTGGGRRAGRHRTGPAA